MRFSGYGLIIIVIDYFGGLVILSKLSSYLFKTERWQYIVLLLFHIIITFINFFNKIGNIKSGGDIEKKAVKLLGDIKQMKRGNKLINHLFFL